tara:strand:- start:116 stop:349 length:234 start_codon:yes stop_codon:yes gene_type:complete
VTPSLIIIAVASFFILTNDNVAAAFYFVLRLARANIKRQIWWLFNNPANPVVKYIVYRRSLKTSKELIAEINKNNET